MFDKRKEPYNRETEYKQWNRYFKDKLESVRRKLSDLETIARTSSILILVDETGAFHVSASADLQPFNQVFIADSVRQTILNFRNSTNGFHKRVRSEAQDITSASIPNIPTLDQRPMNRRMQKFTFPWEFEGYMNLEIMGRLSYCFSTLTQDCLKSVGPRWIDLVWKNRGVYGEASRKPQGWPLPHYNSGWMEADKLLRFVGAALHHGPHIHNERKAMQ
ncbi:hypothetical protein BKA69DRAFT_1084790 [Paraphysoderma sedebokerense]|nr:hypothetical protein BKA69DRAFT_1084790 [Paraphysoderma sedebokerense]